MSTNPTETAEIPQVIDKVTPMTVGLTAQERCDRCGAQAYYEVEVNIITKTEDGRDINKKVALYFCSHHANEHHDTLAKHESVTRIFDHRPVLAKEESIHHL